MYVITFLSRNNFPKVLSSISIDNRFNTAQLLCIRFNIIQNMIYLYFVSTDSKILRSGSANKKLFKK